jgi:signal peptidase II
MVLGWVVTILVLDQLTKMIVDRTMSLHQSIPIIDGLFSLTYVRNTGAAFGIFAGSHEAFRLPFLILVSVLALGFVVVMLKRLRDEEIGLITALSLLSAALLAISSTAFYTARSSIFSTFIGRIITGRPLTWPTVASP